MLIFNFFTYEFNYIHINMSHKILPAWLSVNRYFKLWPVFDMHLCWYVSYPDIVYGVFSSTRRVFLTIKPKTTDSSKQGTSLIPGIIVLEHNQTVIETLTDNMSMHKLL